LLAYIGQHNLVQCHFGYIYGFRVPN
jgi:hypothetical protein